MKVIRSRKSRLTPQERKERNKKELLSLTEWMDYLCNERERVQDMYIEGMILSDRQFHSQLRQIDKEYRRCRKQREVLLQKQ